jgi:NADH-quinone oxidoreductase subunit E
MEAIQLAQDDVQRIDGVVAKHKGKHGELLSILEEVQVLNAHKYLSEEALNLVALRTGVPLSRLYSVVTFYSFFNLRPQGDHTITVCRGTACHTKGSKALHDDLRLFLGYTPSTEEEGSSFTTPDNKFTVSTVACFGQCALAPVAAIDGTIYSNLTSSKLQKLLSGYTRIRRAS